MNIQLAQTIEYIDGKNTGTLGMVLIRCNNVLWISKAPEDGLGADGDGNGEGGDSEMAG